MFDFGGPYFLVVICKSTLRVKRDFTDDIIQLLILQIKSMKPREDVIQDGTVRYWSKWSCNLELGHHSPRIFALKTALYSFLVAWFMQWGCEGVGVSI